MKKGFVFLVCMLMICGINAQNMHLQFNGIPIDGTIEEFTSSLKEKGYRNDSLNDQGVAFFTGDFAGYKDCHIIVYSHKKVNLVYEVEVVIDENDWDELELDYRSLAAALEKKYGKLDYAIDKFSEMGSFSNGIGLIGVIRQPKRNVRDYRSNSNKSFVLMMAYLDHYNFWHPVKRIPTGDL